MKQVQRAERGVEMHLIHRAAVATKGAGTRAAIDFLGYFFEDWQLMQGDTPILLIEGGLHWQDSRQ